MLGFDIFDFFSSPKLVLLNRSSGLQTISVDKSRLLYQEIDVCNERSSYIPRTARKRRCTICYGGHCRNPLCGVPVVSGDISFEAFSFQTCCREVLIYVWDDVYSAPFRIMYDLKF